jgi:hypothetical protein
MNEKDRVTFQAYSDILDVYAIVGAERVLLSQLLQIIIAATSDWGDRRMTVKLLKACTALLEIAVDANEEKERHHEQCPWNKVDVERKRSVCGCPPGWPK